MWKFKPFSQKEPTGLEGRTVDVGNVKIHIQKAIAEGGFSCVYLARDAVHMSKQYALKHMICNDDESLELAMKEISVMKSLKGHPNVVTLCAHAMFNMGRTKEVLVVMEFCEKSLVSVLESRGVAYFDEKQVLSIFRDVCNAVFAMHCQSPPIAHRDLKAENLLLSSDGLWKLCDFGSTSTNHKRFEKPEEMGIEEDNIRKYTTPAYRAPEMWDLFRRDLISEKVDIWALGCLLFRICYFKNAFDGESKLQVLNGNYRIPELPKYSSFITDLIKDMLLPSPEDRPDIMQVWFRVNEKLPSNLQKSLPDRPPELPSTNNHEGATKPSNRSPPMPSRSPPSPPSSVNTSQQSQSQSQTTRGGGGAGQLGSFWSTQHVKEVQVTKDKSVPIFDEEPHRHRISSKNDSVYPNTHASPKNASPGRLENSQAPVVKRNIQGKLQNSGEDLSKDYEITFQRDNAYRSEKLACVEDKAISQNQTFNTFVAEFDTNKINTVTSKKIEKEMALEAEVKELKEQLKQANLEKAEMTAKFEKLSAICRSQRQEIQDLKGTIAARTPSPSKDALKNHSSPGIQSAIMLKTDKTEIASEPQEAKSDWKTPSTEPKVWQAFPEESNLQFRKSSDSTFKSVRTKSNVQQNNLGAHPTSGFDSWGFGADSFSVVCGGSVSKSSTGGNNAQVSGDKKKIESKPSQPAGWAGF